MAPITPLFVIGGAFTLWDMGAETLRYRRGESFFSSDQQAANFTLKKFNELCKGGNPHPDCPKSLSEQSKQLLTDHEARIMAQQEAVLATHRANYKPPAPPSPTGSTGSDEHKFGLIGLLVGGLVLFALLFG